jgi:hypothetical protein
MYSPVTMHYVQFKSAFALIQIKELPKPTYPFFEPLKNDSATMLGIDQRSFVVPGKIWTSEPGYDSYLLHSEFSLTRTNDKNAFVRRFIDSMLLI